VPAEIAKVKEEAGKDIEMYGSASLMQTLMKHNLIDEFRFWIHPFVLGSGKRLFPENGQAAKLQLVGKATSSGVVIMTYHPPK
jgi:dihydrofolate reductase